MRIQVQRAGAAKPSAETALDRVAARSAFESSSRWSLSCWHDDHPEKDHVEKSADVGGGPHLVSAPSNTFPILFSAAFFMRSI